MPICSFATFCDVLKQNLMLCELRVAIEHNIKKFTHRFPFFIVDCINVHANDDYDDDHHHHYNVDYFDNNLMIMMAT